jgi:hypothetical protein
MFNETRDRYLSLVDTGATRSVAGTEWLEKFAENLKGCGLVPTRQPSKSVFHGLGGVTKAASDIWRLPVGTYGTNQVVEFHAVPGDMIGLWGRKDMKELITSLYLRKELAKVDFEALNLFGLELERLPNKHAAKHFLNFDAAYN